jgi:ATP-dependent Clp protease adaptor protein ClpS
MHTITITRSTTKPGTSAVTEHRITHIPRYKVLLHNDAVNTMDHVVKSLMRVFKFERSVCEGIMIEAHSNGVALCVVEPFEQAELHRDQLTSFSLIATIEPE